MKRTPLKRGTSRLRRRTPLARVGRRARLNRGRRETVVALVRARDVSCQFGGINPAFASACRGELDVHEVIPRSAWPAGVFEVLNCVLLCRRHHCWVDDHPDLAHRVGLHGFSYERPDRWVA